MIRNRVSHIANRFLEPLKFTLTVALACLAFTSFAQNYPVQVSINATGPFYNYLSFYGDQNNHLQLVTTLTDFNAPPTNVKLRLRIEGPGYELRTNPNFQGGNSFLLSPGSPVFIQGFDLAPYLMENALIKEPGSFDLSNMPEGFTTVCVDIIKDGPSQEVLSTNNCYSFFLQRFQPPLPLMPTCESQLDTDQGFYTFQWTPPVGYVPTITSQLEYVFEIYEWNDQSNYSIFQTQQGLIHTETVTQNTIQINEYDVTFQEGMEYIWRVTAVLTDNGLPVQIFENNGISEPCTFQYGESQSLEEQLTDGLEINLTANGMAERKGRAQWTVIDNTPSEGLSNFNSFIVQYRKAQSGSSNTYSWFEDTVTGSQSDIYQLEPSTTYECRVLGLYGNYIGDTSNTESFTTDAARIYACGDADLPYRSPNYSPLEIAEPGITVEIGQFTMKVTQITSTGTPGRYSGKGIVPIDFLMGAQAKVNFDDILIDDEFVVREGRVDVSTDGVENWLHEQYKQFIDPIYVDGSVDDIYVDTAGGSAWITIDGDSTKYDFDPPDYPIIINDEDGNQFTIYPNGTIEQSTYFNISDDYLSVTAGQVATFEEDSSENFGFDAKEHTEWHEQYEIIELDDSSKYFVANKSLATGQSDPVTLIFQDSIPDGDLTYQVGSGSSAQPIQLNGNTATITIPDFSSKGAHALYVYAGNKRVGKLNIHVYDQKEIDVVIVPVANVNLDSTTLNTAINGIFNEANIQVNLSTASQWNNADFTATSTIDLPSDVTNFSKYSEDMRNLRDAYFDSTDTDKSKYYLFVVEGFNGSGNEDGYMVRGKGLGFVSKNATPQTYAHELGHGAGALAHTWKENGPEEGTTNNLMDYNGGSNLTLGQWEELRKMNLVPSFWDEAGDGLYSFDDYVQYYDNNPVWTDIDPIYSENCFELLNGKAYKFGEDDLPSKIKFDKYGRVYSFIVGSDTCEAFIVRNSNNGDYYNYGYLSHANYRSYLDSFPDRGTISVEESNFIKNKRYNFRSCQKDSMVFQHTIPFFHDGNEIIKKYESCLVQRQYQNSTQNSSNALNNTFEEVGIYLGESFRDDDFTIIDGNCQVSPWVQNLNLKGAAVDVYFSLSEMTDDHQSLADLANYISGLAENEVIAFYDHANTDNSIKDYVLFGKSQKDGEILTIDGENNALCSALLREEIYTIQDFNSYYDESTWFSSSNINTVISHVDITTDIPDGYNRHSIDYASFPIPHVKDWDPEEPQQLFDILDLLEDLYNYQLQQNPAIASGDEYNALVDFISNARLNPHEWLNVKLELRMNLIASLDLLGAFKRYSYSLSDLVYREKSSFKSVILNRENEGKAYPIDPQEYSNQYLNKWDTDCAFFLGFEYMKMYEETLFEPVMVANVIGRFSKLNKSYRSFDPDFDDLLRRNVDNAGIKIFNNISDAVGAHIDDITTRLYRGDLRKPDEIFGSGFTAKGTNSNIVDYVELNEPSIFIGTSKSPQEAFTKVSQTQAEGYVYVLGKNGNTTDINNWYNSIEGYSNPYASELEVVFENAIPSSNIQGAFKINASGEIIGDIILNPNFIP